MRESMYNNINIAVFALRFRVSVIVCSFLSLLLHLYIASVCRRGSSIPRFQRHLRDVVRSLSPVMVLFLCMHTHMQYPHDAKPLSPSFAAPPAPDVSELASENRTRCSRECSSVRTAHTFYANNMMNDTHTQPQR